MFNRSLLFAAVAFFTVTALEHAPAVWRGPPQMLAALDAETRDWVIGLRNNIGGPCCDTADGFPVEVDGWDMAGQERLSCSAGRRRMARRAEFRADRSENQQAWLCCGLATPARDPSDLLFPSRGWGLS